MKKKNIPALAALILAAILWGASFPAAGFLVRKYNNWTIMFIRMVSASLAFLAVPRKAFKFQYRKGDWIKLVGLVLFLPCLYFLFETTALNYTSSVQAGVISSAVPLFVAVGAFFFLRERLNFFSIAGLGLSIGGVVLLTLWNSGNTAAANPSLGNLLECLAMVCAAGNMLMIKSLSNRYNPFILTLFQSLGGILFFSVGIGGMGSDFWSQLTLLDGLLMIFLGVGVAFGAFLLYNLGLSKLKASSASLSINLVPVFAVLFGWIFLGENLSLQQLGASFLVIAGVLVGQIQLRPKAPETDTALCPEEG